VFVEKNASNRYFFLAGSFFFLKRLSKRIKQVLLVIIYSSIPIRNRFFDWKTIIFPLFCSLEKKKKKRKKQCANLVTWIYKRLNLHQIPRKRTITTTASTKANIKEKLPTDKEKEFTI
jgi:hypothetical protein